MKSTAVLLCNLGSPDSFHLTDVKKYLCQFLIDERVIDIPPFFRKLLVRGIIVPFRAPKSAAKYKSIWTEQGSPLIHISRQVQSKLAFRLSLPVELCMRYGNPKPDAALQNLQNMVPNLKQLVLVPLYPHYAMSSYETAVEYVRKTLADNRYSFSLKVVPPFYNHPAYIRALAASIKPYLEDCPDHVLFSYHGVPVRHIIKSDITGNHCFTHSDCCNRASEVHKVCYRHQATVTTKLVANALSLTSDKYSISFQSRLGRDKWLQPYTSVELKMLPARGVKRLVVVCPAFVSDCLETLEEILAEGKDIFLKAGGKQFTFVPCLNQRDDWIQTLVQLVQEQL